jgi:hypothetical protein
MKRFLVLSTIVLAAVANTAEARKPCEELGQEIAAKLDAKGVKNYQLEIVAAADVGAAKVVGSCDGGTQRITYTRAAPAPVAIAGNDGSHPKTTVE